MRSTATRSLLLLALAAGCSPAGDLNPAVASLEVVAPVYLDAMAHSTHLSGDQERPTPVDTRATGQFILKDNGDGTLSYRLIASNIQNVTMAHIHLISMPNGTGGVVVWLYPSAPPPQLIPGRHSGVLATGTISAASLTGALANQPLSALLDAIEDGRAYVNVHTSQYPAGEIRGDM